MLAGKSLRTRAGEQRMFARGHHQPGQCDRMAYPLHGGHRAEVEVTAIHDDGVQFDLASGVEEGAIASVEGGVVLHDAHGGLDRIQRRPTTRKHGPARFRRAAAAVHVSLVGLAGDVVGTPVDHDSR